MILLAALALLGLLVCSAFFSASETALVALSPQKAKTLALSRPRVAAALHGWLAKPHELLTLILVVNTFVNVLFAAFLTLFFIRLLPSVGPNTVKFIAWVAGTFALVLLGEMMPKFFARANPEKASLIALPWLSRLNRLVAPALKLVIAPLQFFFPQLKSPPVGQLLTFSLEELKALLEEDAQERMKKDDSRDMMQRILEINDRRAENVMTKIEHVDFIDLDTLGRPRRDRDYLIDRIVEEGHTRTPVKSGGRFIGFIHSDDLMPFLLRDSEQDLTTLIRKALDVPQDRRVGDLLQDFRSSSVHIGFVRNPQDDVLGIVTLEDVLEEITGEILDEFDVANPSPEPAS